MNLKKENKQKHLQSDSLIDLYSRIPDYSEVKHLGNSDFIKTLERLKEEFRQCRATLYNEDSDIDYISEQTAKVLNIHTEDQNNDTSLTNVRNRNLLVNNGDRSYLSVTSCEIHRNPYSGSGSYLHKSNRSINFQNDNSNDGFYQDDGDGGGYSGASTPDSCLSRWSSNPEIHSRRKEFFPPTNIEHRLLMRKPQNNSAPTLPKEDEAAPPHFRANPVPSHVYKPLFEYIMLKNKKRSQRVREESKQKLLAQVKPFSFTKDSKASHISFGTHVTSENLNNARPQKIRKLNSAGQSVKTNNNKFSSSQHFFKANPAPPRTKALLSAIRLKEQQDYRDLKKRLRSEALMKSASLPPSMAARDKRTKLNKSKIEAILRDYCNSTPRREKNLRRGRKESSADDSNYTDDDRMTEDSYSQSKPSQSIKQKIASERRLKNFTPFGLSRHSAAAEGVFESTSNDNHASRLRVQTAKMKEEARIQQEEEELLRFMRAEKHRQKLRDAHASAWRRACSYSASQDIAMRRQLRMAASILERESFRKDMSSMLSRVRSAPLLLEGGREQCTHECLRAASRRAYSRTKAGVTPRGLPYYATRENWTGLGGGAEDKSETAAVAEGSLTNSDNESVKDIALDHSRDSKRESREDEENSASQHDDEDEEIEEIENDN